ncbi:MAG: radical SAM protein, partial [Chloroflexi bacterium]|nr:radical SAM protein [Chloroflexota bacterium]
VLNMLDLAGIPVLADNRDESHPLVIAGGICALNPEPMADFIDIFVIGEGEEVVFELLESYREWKLSDKPGGKTGLLRKAARIEGIYVPTLYKVDYCSDGVVCSITPLTKEAKLVIKRRILAELPPLPDRLIVPYIQTVHDRAPVEIQRGCVQGCRFCQAGMIYRPLRHRSQEVIVDNVGKLIDNCGFDEVSLLSLSSSDYQGIDELVGKLLEKYNDRHITLSLPSLRMDSFTLELAEALNIKRKSSFTFAPEAGNESLRKAINKKLTDESLLKTCEMILERGWTNLKFYFMIGLPSEKLSDVEDILNLVWKIRSLRTATGRRLP